MVAGDESGGWVFREAERVISDSLKCGRQAEGAGVQHKTKPRKHAATQYTVVKAKLRRLLLIKSVPGCLEYISTL